MSWRVVAMFSLIRPALLLRLVASVGLFGGEVLLLPQVGDGHTQKKIKTANEFKNIKKTKTLKTTRTRSIWIRMILD